MEEESSSSTGDNPGGQCEMCSNYELSLQTMQAEQDTLREQLAAAKELYEKYGKELSEERLYRKELEARFATLNEETERNIQTCFNNAEGFEERLILLGKKQESDLAEMGKELEMARDRQTKLQKDLEVLHGKYQKLLHKNAQKADEMQEQCIDLPQTVDELTLLALQLREDLISEKVAREHECQELRDELAVAREQMLEMEIREKEQEENVLGMLAAAQQQQSQHRRRERHRLMSEGHPGSTSAHLSRNSPSSPHLPLEQTAVDATAEVADVDCACSNGNCRRLVSELESRLSHSLNERAKLQSVLAEQKNKCAQMQSELNTSEAVQKDFVRLSQNLQVELEKIRQSECEVRWQNPEDVNFCTGCNRDLTPGVGRVNCRHCGKIFCPSCCHNKVLSGPLRRPVPVCPLCHTLLSNKHHSLIDQLNSANHSA